MSNQVTWAIKHEPKGYYSLWINGVWCGNYDTYTEAYTDYILTTKEN